VYLVQEHQIGGLVFVKVAVRACTVSFVGPSGVRHSVGVTAESVYEAAEREPMNANDRRVGLMVGALLTGAGLIAGFLPSPWHNMGDLLLRPGIFLPEWYWGGFGDVPQIGIALVLNVFFYMLVTVVIRAFWRRAKPSPS
jgi:hypothetical protein